MSEPIEPFSVAVDPEAVCDLRERLVDTCWPDQLPGTGWEYGANLEAVQSVCADWREGYDFEAYAERLNRFDSYVTEVDGQRVHFYHVESPETDSRPLMLVHGWPGSVVEFLDVIGPLTDPASHDGDPETAVDLVVPSLPGYGFSGPTTERGWDVKRVAGAFRTMMWRLGYEEFLAQGGDWGSLVVSRLAADHPDRLAGVHTNMLSVQPSALGFEDPMAVLNDEERAVVEEVQAFRETETGYQAIQSTKPQTLVYGLTDSPAGLAGWLVEKFETWTDGGLDAVDRTRLLDNLTTYWLTGTVGSSTRLYYETDLAETLPEEVSVPTGHARYPGEIYKPPRTWAEQVYDVVHWAEMEAGGHFAAMEVPDLFVADLQAWLRAVRSAGRSA